MAVRDQRFGFLAGGDDAEARVQQEGSAETGAQILHQRAGGRILVQHAQVGELQGRQGIHQNLVGLLDIRCVKFGGTLHVVLGRDTDTDPVGANRVHHGPGHFNDEARTVRRRTPVDIVALVGGRGQEFVQQVTVGRVQLDAVEPGTDRIAGRRDELLDDARQFLGGQGVRHRERLLPLVGAGLAVDRDGAGRHHLVTTVGVFVRDTSGMHHLGEDAAALGVHGSGDIGPALELFLGHQAGLAREPPAGGAGIRALTDDQAEGSPLPVVLDNQRAGNAFLAGADAGQRRHHKSVGQFQLAESHRGKQHAQFLSPGIGFSGYNCTAPATIPGETRITTGGR